MGAEAVKLHRNHRELVGGPEPVGVPRGRVCGWRYCQTAAQGKGDVLTSSYQCTHYHVIHVFHTGSQAFSEHRQVMGKDHD